LLSWVFALGLAPEADAQRRPLARRSQPPMREVVRDLGGNGTADEITLDFETDDAARPLVDGQDIQSGEEFGLLVDVDGYPASGQRAAIFDSAPGGPNDPSQDLDLLVDLGNVLILQGQPAQSVPGIYHRPNDDANGGYFSLDFLGQPVTPCALDLIDIDPGLDFATVQLVDALGRLRTYTVPGGWTEDLVSNGPPAYRTLDLTLLCPQPGFLAAATATEQAGFDPTQVLSMQVVLGGSGALDNLVFAPRTFPRRIDFEDLGIALGNQINSAPLVGIESGGFLFKPTLNSSIQDVHAGNNVAVWSSNGTTILAGHLEIRMSRADGEPFSLERFDFSGWPINAEGPLTLLASNGAVANYVLDGRADGPGGFADFETFVLSPGFTDVTSVLFLYDEPSFASPFALDNVCVRVDHRLVLFSSSGATPAGENREVHDPADPCLGPRFQEGRSAVRSSRADQARSLHSLPD